MSENRPIVHLYYSPMEHESRLLRAAKSVVEEGLASEAIGIGYCVGGAAKHEILADGVVYRRLAPPRWSEGGGKMARLLRWPLWTYSATCETVRAKPAIVQAHSLAALPSAILAARLFGKASLVYDAHELESERTGWSRGLRWIARIVERLLIRFVDEMIVVSGTIADWYADAYGIDRPHLVRNMPEAPPNTLPLRGDIRGELKLPESAIIFVYLGRLGHGRGIPILVEAFERCQQQRHLVLMGNGPMESWLRDVAANYANIHLIPPVASGEVIHFIASADVGLSLVEDVSLSYRYSLPNKLFECRHAGLPVIVSNMLEMASFVREYGGGWIIEQNVAEVAALVNSIEKIEVERVCANALPVPRWEDDRARYVKIIARLLRL